MSRLWPHATRDELAENATSESEPLSGENSRRWPPKSGIRVNENSYFPVLVVVPLCAATHRPSGENSAEEKLPCVTSRARSVLRSRRMMASPYASASSLPEVGAMLIGADRSYTRRLLPVTT